MLQEMVFECSFLRTLGLRFQLFGDFKKFRHSIWKMGAGLEGCEFIGEVEEWSQL